MTTPTDLLSIPFKGRTELMTVDEAHALAVSINQALAARVADSAKIKLRVCHDFGVRLQEMDSDLRPARVVFPRQIAMWLHRTTTNLDLATIGSRFPRRSGKARDHGTVHHACRVVEDRMGTDAKLCARILALQKELLQ